MFFLVFETYSSIQSCSLVQNYSDKTISKIQIPGKLLVSKVNSLGISSGFDYRSLQNGNSVQYNGVTITSEDIIGLPTPGYKLFVVDFRKINSFFDFNFDFVVHFTQLSI
jgi:ribonuclease BN (tRNA processing enzyme)